MACCLSTAHDQGIRFGETGEALLPHRQSITWYQKRLVNKKVDCKKGTFRNQPHFSSTCNDACRLLQPKKVKYKLVAISEQISENAFQSHE